ncbi:hypothetical protein GCM10020229_74630 [Kitasatospora albolonga]
MLGTITSAKRFQRVLPKVWDMRVLLLGRTSPGRAGPPVPGADLGWERAASSVAATTNDRTDVQPKKDRNRVWDLRIPPCPPTAGGDRRRPGGDLWREDRASPIVLESQAKYKRCVTDG